MKSFQRGGRRPELRSKPGPHRPVSAVPALFATVRTRPCSFRPVKTAFRRREAVLTGRNGPRCAWKQGRNSADGCGEDRASGVITAAGRRGVRPPAAAAAIHHTAHAFPGPARHLPRPPGCVEDGHRPTRLWPRWRSGAAVVSRLRGRRSRSQN